MAALNVNLAHITMPTTENSITNESKNEKLKSSVNLENSDKFCYLWKYNNQQYPVWDKHCLKVLFSKFN